MAATPQTVEELARPAAEAGGWTAALRNFVRRRPLGAVGAAIILVMAVLALFQRMRLRCKTGVAVSM